ncbi:MAG: 3-methyl-2-oxobutanoate dehydrogenase subunit VorB, partial [Clostridia bacterium]|nr:3-methyl-2-oxobutanoate dehydrogenase subunit VorB [Clostridia bacterium]
MAKRMPKCDGVFLQAESEVSAINMVIGVASCGKRVLTSSSSPGISLKSEGISYLAGCELPALIINVQRGGPGLGGIQPSQSDYFQAVKGGGHGDYKLIVLAPASVQEMVDLTFKGFDLADKYRMPAMILADGTLGQMMEPVSLDKGEVNAYDKSWATTGTDNHEGRNVINSLSLSPAQLEAWNISRYERYAKIEKEEVMYEEYMMDDAEICIVAIGIAARISKNAILEARKKGIKVGMIRPITLFPFPKEVLNKAAGKVKSFLSVELNMGQMVDDVKLAINCSKPVYFYGRTGGVLMTPDEIVESLEKINKGEAKQW